MKNKNLMPFIFTIRNFIVLIKWFPRIISFIVFFIVIDYILAHSERIAVTFSSWTARGVMMKLFVLWIWTIFSFLSFFRVCEKSSKTWNSWRFPRPGGFILSLFKAPHYFFSKIVNQIFFGYLWRQNKLCNNQLTDYQVSQFSWVTSSDRHRSVHTGFYQLSIHVTHFVLSYYMHKTDEELGPLRAM